MRNNEIENEIGKIKEQKKKIKRKCLNYETANTDIMLSNMKQDLLVIAFVLVKVMQLKLKRIKAIC